MQAFIWLNEAHSHYEDNLLYSKSTSLQVDFIQKYPHKNIQNNLWPHIWTPWPSQVNTSNFSLQPLIRMVSFSFIDKASGPVCFPLFFNGCLHLMVASGSSAPKPGWKRATLSNYPEDKHVGLICLQGFPIHHDQEQTRYNENYKCEDTRLKKSCLVFPILNPILDALSEVVTGNVWFLLSMYVLEGIPYLTTGLWPPEVPKW